MTKPKQHGGARKGAGRKKQTPTATISIRHEKKVVDKVKKKYKKQFNQLGKEWLNSLIKKSVP